jgi:hypothetical protein
MAVINKTGITNGGTIEVGHVTRSIDALSGGSTDTIIATGSFSGSLKGDANLNTLNVDTIYFLNTPYTVAGSGGNNIILNYDDDDTNTTIKHHGGSVSSSFLETSLTINAPVIASSFTGSLSGTATSASYAVTASYALNAGGGSSFPYTGSALISGSLAVTGSTSILGFVTMTGFLQGNLESGGDTIVDLHNMGKSGGSGKFVVPVNVATSPTAGALYWDDANGFLYIYQESTTSWRRVALS